MTRRQQQIPGFGARRRRDLLRALRRSRHRLGERIKELRCLGRVGLVLDRQHASLEALLAEVAAEMPAGWQHPALAMVRITLEGTSAATPDYCETPWCQQCEIRVQDVPAGMIEVAYREAPPDSDEKSVFLREEANLLELIARKLGLVAARLRAETALRARLDEVADLYEHAPCGYHSLAADGRLLKINDTELGWLGYTREELIGRCHISELMTAASRKIFATHFPQFLEHGAIQDLELEFVRKDGSHFTVLLSAVVVRDAEGRFVQSRSVMFDISERKKAERAMQRLARMRAMSSAVNAAITTAASRDALLRDACRIAVECGEFRMAWIGLLNDAQHLQPVAVFGYDAGYVETLQISLDPDDQRGRGPSAQALREGRHALSHDIASDPQMAPWREAALARGYRASVALPLSAAGKLVGVINLYAAEAEVLDAPDLQLLDELAADISLALTSIEQRRQIEFLAWHDPLTGLPNRARLLDELSLRLRGAVGTQALLLLDIEHFKQINDALGMAAGDEALSVVAERLRGFAAGLLIARVGADVFAILVNDPELARAGSELAARLSVLLAAPLQIAGQSLQLQARIGIAVAPHDGDEAFALFRNAEAALKNAKLARVPFLYYAAEMNQAARRRLHLESRLQRAVEQREFELHYQPKLTLADGRVCGCEALLRWDGTRTENVDTAQMVRVLEDTGLIVEVGRWALQQAADDHRRWREQGLAAPDIAVNVSVRQLREPQFAAGIAQLAQQAAGAPLGVSLEITESVLMQDIDARLPLLRQLRELGFAVAIDDFGTGYSSLSYLLQLPVSALKIDRSFIHAMSGSHAATNLVAAIISLGHSMSLRVVAEGVETAEQLRYLRLLRCDEAQGWLFSRALNHADFAALLRDDGASLRDAFRA